MRQLVLSRRVGVCSLTARRRLDHLVQRNLAKADERRRYVVTNLGLKALGDAVPQKPAPWIDSMKISAANARDVVSRGGEIPTDDRTTAQRSRHSSMGAAKGAATVRLRKRQPSNWVGEFDLTG